MLLFGLTGGIASGKSAVAAMLRDLGFVVLDADSLAHSLIEPGQPTYGEVVAEFGPGILQPDGRVDRQKLGALVFASTEKLGRLNAIVHPRVRDSLFARAEALRREGRQPAAFVEAALLVEAGYLPHLDGLVVAWCRPEQQLERLRARGISEEEARRRVATQMPVADKLQHATHRIDCSGSLESTREQVLALAETLRRPSGALARDTREERAR